MTRATRVQVLAAIVMLFALGASSVCAVSMAGLSGRYKMVYTTRAEDAASWEVSAGIAMGAFRGIFVNWLWIRANDLKEAGKFHEANDLANAITKLQPRFPRVWVFHAWNMAYNISVSTQTKEERWNWVKSGINLLRDKGIPVNPNDMLLHKELAWIFLHKIGGYTDDANVYYKVKLAEEWQTVLGPPPQRTKEDHKEGAAKAKYVAWLTTIAQAPDTLESAIETEPTVKALVEILKKSSSAEDLLGLRLLRQYEVYRTMSSSVRAKALTGGAHEKIRAFGAIFEDPAYAKAWAVLLPHLRKRVLVDVYHMEPERMVAYTQKYGPIDWRHHAAHSLYWAARGVEAAMPRFFNEGKRDFDFLNTDRIVVQSAQDLFRSGEVYYDYFASISGQHAMWQGVPNVDFVDTYGSILQEMRERSWADQKNMRAYTPLSAGYENFLRDVVCFLYRRGDLPKAEIYFTKLRTMPDVNLNNPFRIEEMARPLAEFVAEELKGRLTSPNIGVQQVFGSLIGAYTSGLLGNDHDVFESQRDFAKMVHRFYMEQQLKKTAVGNEYERMGQMDKDFGFLAGQTFDGFLRSQSLDDAERAYDAAPDDLKSYALYFADQTGGLRSRFGQMLEADKKAGGRGFDDVFLPPPGFEQMRAEIDLKIKSRQQNNSNLEQK